MANQSLADGQVAATATAIITGDQAGSTRLGISFCNTNATSETLVVTFSRQGGTQRRIARAVLATNETLQITGLAIQPGDTVYAATTTAAYVDYLVCGSVGGDYSVQSYDANGALKQVNTGISGNQTVTGNLILPDSSQLVLGTGSDITAAWDGTDLDILQAAANSSIKWGIDGAGMDQVWYGDTASTSMTWDQSADSLIFTGAVDVSFVGTTGQPEITLTDNLADALSIKIPSGNDLMVFKTTNSAEEVTIPNNFAAGSNATDRVTIKGIYMSPANVAVTVPTIADAEIDEVAVDVSSAFSVQPAVGDAVIAIPQEALPTDCILCGAYVSNTDEITVSFAAKEGGSGVTGAAKNFKFVVLDLT